MMPLAWAPVPALPDLLAVAVALLALRATSRLGMWPYAIAALRAQ